MELWMVMIMIMMVSYVRKYELKCCSVCISYVYDDVLYND